MITLKSMAVSSDFWDEIGCPVKPPRWGEKASDGGDVLHRIGLQAIELYWKTLEHPKLAMQARDMFIEQLEVHHFGWGNFCRYWKATDIGDWWTKPNTMSRDQMIPIVIACGLWRLDHWLNTIESGLKRRNMFFTNTMVNGKPNSKKTPDIAGPAFWAMMARAKMQFASPVIAIGDKEELIGTHLICLKTSPPKFKNPFTGKDHYPFGGPKLHSDPVNKTMVLLFNKWTFETPDAIQARIVYAKKGRVWESWRRYWLRYNMSGTRIIDPQCPFHLAFADDIKHLGKRI